MRSKKPHLFLYILLFIKNIFVPLQGEKQESKGVKKKYHFLCNNGMVFVVYMNVRGEKKNEKKFTNPLQIQKIVLTLQSLTN